MKRLKHMMAIVLLSSLAILSAKLMADGKNATADSPAYYKCSEKSGVVKFGVYASSASAARKSSGTVDQKYKQCLMEALANDFSCDDQVHKLADVTVNHAINTMDGCAKAGAVLSH